MSQSSKSAYYKALQEQGVKFDRHYRTYSTEELKAAYEVLAEKKGLPAVVIETAPAVPPRSDEVAELREQLGDMARMLGKIAGMIAQPAPAAPAAAAVPKPALKPVTQGLDPSLHAGVTLNTHGPDEPLRIDEYGNKWFQNEVNKPGFPRPRGRRVLRDMDPGTVTETITVNGYTETFEIPGDAAHAKPMEIKVTLPSFQTGIYKAPSMPFKIHTYQGVRAFDWEDVNAYYGGADLVPSSIKHVYVSSDLCYDIATAKLAIEDEYRERVLKKEISR